MKKPGASLAYAIFFLMLFTVLLTLPGSAFPKENWLDKIWFDKWVHIGMFTILVALWCWVMLDLFKQHPKLKNFFVLITVLFIGYGIAIEFIQLNFVKNRSFDTGDIIADIIGCLAGWIFSVSRYIKK
ncbi:MAG TPA: VanZ family protein [Chitinophagaceae bacterium]